MDIAILKNTASVEIASQLLNQLKTLYLSKYLSRVNKHIWRDKWGILKTYVTA